MKLGVWLGQLKWESLKKRRKHNRLILLYKGLKGKSSVPTDDLIPKTRRGRNQHSMAFQTPIANTDVYKGSFFPQAIRHWNTLPDSPSHLLKMQMIVLLSSILWWELWTTSLITGPGQWLSFRRFTSKLSWSWSWPLCGIDPQCWPKRTTGWNRPVTLTYEYTWTQSTTALTYVYNWSESTRNAYQWVPLVGIDPQRLPLWEPLDEIDP